MIRRAISVLLLEALADSPVVLLHGARQTGKSTLAQWVATGPHPARYLTLDDAAVLSAARADPAGFVAGLGGAVVLDEVQRAQELFLAIKANVDRDRRPGRFLLTGSANVLLLPRLSESLAGRMQILTLWPLSQGEIEGFQDTFVDAVFSKPIPSFNVDTKASTGLIERILRGGYPPVLNLPIRRRDAWFGSYVTAILQRDVRDLANIERLTELPRLLALLATRAASLLNFSELSRDSTLPQSTLKRYIALLETTFLVYMLPAWSSNLGKRLLKSPKVTLCDTGLISYLLHLNARRLTVDAILMGHLLETFVAMELRKQATWSRVRPELFHFRTQEGREVDIVLEDRAGRIVGIEVKASAEVKNEDLKGLRSLAEMAGRRFHHGIILYLGQSSVPFGSNLHALPVSSVWELGRTIYEKGGRPPRKAEVTSALQGSEKA